MCFHNYHHKNLSEHPFFKNASSKNDISTIVHQIGRIITYCPVLILMSAY